MQTKRVDHVGCFKRFSEDRRLVINYNKSNVFKLRGFSPRANHTDRVAAAGRRS